MSVQPHKNRIYIIYIIILFFDGAAALNFENIYFSLMEKAN